MLNTEEKSVTLATCYTCRRFDLPIIRLVPVIVASFCLLSIRAEKEKTRREHVIPISTRLLAILEMRKLGPAGQPFGPDAYVFGDGLGRRVKSVREAWKNAAAKAGLKNFQLRDLRHEAGSRFDEAGMPIDYVSHMLGHSNLSTTSRYLNINRRGLHLAMQRFEDSRNAKPTNETANETKKESVAQPLHTADDAALAVVRESRPSDPAKPLVS